MRGWVSAVFALACACAVFVLSTLPAFGGDTGTINALTASF